MIEGKVWGETVEIYRTENVSVHALTIRAGGYSSRHSHRSKSNYFYVIDGAVTVRTWRGDHAALVDEITLRAGQSTMVRPGLLHQFDALEASRMIEIYFVGLEGPDIDRLDVGGLRCEAEMRAKRKTSD